MDVYKSLGVQFDLALDTKQALDFLSKNKYDLIISDLGRDNMHEAGVKMISEIKQMNLEISHPPIFIYASEKAIEKYGKNALDEGASIATASARDLVLSINQILNMK